MTETIHGAAASPARRKLRIAIFGSRGIPHTYGGAEAFLGELAPRLAERGHEVLVYCRRSLFKERSSSYKGVRLIYLPSIETKVLGTPTHTLLCVLDMLFRRVDVALVVNIVNAFHCVLPRLFGKKITINVDGMDWKRDKWGALAKKYFYWNAQWVGRICGKGVLTDAYEMRRIYLEEFATPSVCIAYGANIERSTNPEVLREYGLEPFQYYLIASRMVPENNADLIVQAFERVKSQRILAIAGSANYRSAFIDRLKQTKDPRVRFLGHVGNAEHVKELHCNAYAYLHGHSMGGTNPSLLKALGYGNCVVALRTPFNEEVMTDHGIFFERDAEDLARKMQDLESRPEMAAEYRRRAPGRIREAYTWDKITDQYEELFLQLAAGEDPTRVHSTVRNLASKKSEYAAVAAGAASD
ncbi:MAG TPA: glycosyltransferase [Candidatus Dormibacteraeota bacterium]|nr:glycosyltransferase [Candidatus Dormibacteraeota bacterium]